MTLVASHGTRIEGEETSTASDDTAIVQPFVSETTVLVMKLDPQRIGLPDLTENLKSMSPEVQQAYQRWTTQPGQSLEWLRATTGGQTIYATVGIPLSKSQWPAFAFVKKSPAVSPESLTQRLNLANPAQCCERGQYVVVTPVHEADAAKLLDTSPPIPRADLANAFEAVDDYPLQVLLLPPDYVRKTIQELMPQLPSQLGGGPSNVLTDGIRWASLGLDPAKFRGELIIQSVSDNAARKLADHLPRLLQSVYAALPDALKQENSELVKKLLRDVESQVLQNQVTVQLDGFELISKNLQLLTEATQAIQQTMGRQGNRNSFKQILLGMHNYYDVYKSLPPSDKVRDAEGHSKLSWRVYILPFVENVQLYQEFHLDEAWDSPHNKTLLEKMPDIYRARTFGDLSRDDIKPGYTTFLAPVGEDTIFGGTKATLFSHITDGTSNTVVLVEAKPELAVPWTAPDDYVFDPANPNSGLQIGPDGKFLAALADGSVLEPRGDLKPEQFLRLFRMSDGEVVDLQEMR